MKPQSTLSIKPQKIQGNGSSLWCDSKSTFTVDSVSVGYINWECYPLCADTDRIHASVTLAGPTTDGDIYTDTAVEKTATRNRAIMDAVKKLVTKRLSKAGIRRSLPELRLSWSEYGMQGERFWNFDLCAP